MGGVGVGFFFKERWGSASQGEWLLRENGFSGRMADYWPMSETAKGFYYYKLLSES